MITSESKKKEVWLHALSIPRRQRPHGMTDKVLDSIRPKVWNDEGFWKDIVWRHNLQDTTIVDLMQMHPATYQHMLGNLWGQLVAIWKGYY